MNVQNNSIIAPFQWKPQPDAARVVDGLLEGFCTRCPYAIQLAKTLRSKTGTRLLDWMERLGIPAGDPRAERLPEVGFVSQQTREGVAWHHPGGMFPVICVHDKRHWLAAIKVESVEDFLAARPQVTHAAIAGNQLAPVRRVVVGGEPDAELWVVERHGEPGWEARDVDAKQAEAIGFYRQEFENRKRHFDQPEAGFEHAKELITRAVDQLGVSHTCDLFFAAERAYWTSRNHAAQTQTRRQDAPEWGGPTTTTTRIVPVESTSPD